MSDKVVQNYRARGFECLCGNARMAARAVTSFYDEGLRPSGLRATQLAVLWAVVALPGATIKAIAKCIAMDATTLTRNLRVMADDGLVELAEGEDRRERAVRPTAKGRRLFAKAMPLWEQTQARFARLSGQDTAAMNRLLLAISRPARK
jgi:DNA-binding MarR family transcriptional regulator